jgi:hypothetical protein
VVQEVIDDTGYNPDHHLIAPEDSRPMNATTAASYDRLGPAQAGRAIWVALIVISGPCLSLFFACVTPFAALATLAGLKLGRRDMIAVTGVVWLANQVIGYGFLDYPRTWDSAAWGLVIGASSALAVVAATALSTTRPAPLAISLPFVAAFAAFEFGLYLAGYLLPVSEGAFSASVVWHVFLVNGVTLCALMAVFHLAMMLWLLVRNSAPGPVGAAS